MNLGGIPEKNFSRYPLEKGVFFKSLYGMSRIPQRDMASC